MGGVAGLRNLLTLSVSSLGWGTDEQQQLEGGGEKAGLEIWVAEVHYRL